MSFSKRLGNLNAYDLHKTLINEYFLTVKSRSLLLQRDTSKDKRDIDVIKENHQFLWEDEESANQSWEKTLAKKYYDKLYKEYCVGDLSRYKENKIGLRWRIKQELIDGKGQFSCGSMRCRERENLKTWEVNFGYVEQGIKKNALVKIRLCPDCSYKLNYHHKKKEVKTLKYHRHTLKKDSRKESLRKNKEEKTEDIKDGGEVSLEIKDDRKAESAKDLSESDIWKQVSVEDEETKTREEEFDEYLDQLFL